MKKLVVDPTNSVNGVPFGADREAVRKEFGKKYKEIKKTIFSENTLDAYEDFHIYYTVDNRFDAIEVFGKVKVFMDGNAVFPGDVSDVTDCYKSFKKDGDGIISKDMSIGITVDQDDDKIITGILFGREGYYNY